MNRRLLIVSTSKIHGSEYMEYLLDELGDFFISGEILFIPFARPSGISHQEYTEKASAPFKKIGLKVRGLHEFEDKNSAIRGANGIFTGGGNTFLLLKTLYEYGVMDMLRETVINGTPYMGSSAGSNIAGLSIGTTNDMPIVYPPTFRALQLLPFNLNPHYLDPEPNSNHQGETREARINEFHKFNDQPVVGLREGSWLRREGSKMQLKGDLSARIFRKGEKPFEQMPGDVSHLLD